MSKYICECGLYISNNANKGAINIHNKSNAHQLRIKYKDILEDNKLFCNICNIKIDLLKYESHLESVSHNELAKYFDPLVKSEPLSIPSTITCDCGLIVTNTKGSINCHLRSSGHTLRLKYKDILLEKDKIFCKVCNTKLDLLRYEEHLESDDHKFKFEMSKKYTLSCECGYDIVMYDDTALRKHYSSGLHQKGLRLKHSHLSEDEFNYLRKTYNKFRKFESSKVKNNNCCERCLAINIPERYYNAEQKLCICCIRINKGGNNKCATCKQEKDITLFERPYLFRCKSCASLRQQKVQANKKLQAEKERQEVLDNINKSENNSLDEIKNNDLIFL